MELVSASYSVSSSAAAQIFALNHASDFPDNGHHCVQVSVPVVPSHRLMTPYPLNHTSVVTAAQLAGNHNGSPDLPGNAVGKVLRSRRV